MNMWHRLGLLSGLLALVFLLAACAWTYAQDSELTQIKERELEQVREKISDLKSSMDRQAAERDRISADLQAAEVLIAEQRNHLKDLERQRDFSEKKKAELEEKLANRKAELNAETEQLEQLEPFAEHPQSLHTVGAPANDRFPVGRRTRVR